MDFYEQIPNIVITDKGKQICSLTERQIPSCLNEGILPIRGTIMRTMLKPNGELVTINNHNIHIYRQGNINHPKLIFMSGSGTVAPVYNFKMLYEKLQNDFRIIVLEKFGYGYSDIFEASCDIDNLVSMQKQALDLVGEKGPYILVSHSMSGLEAIRWKQKYPEDIQAIIGIDMATPLTYGNWTDKEVAKRIKLIKRSHTLKLHKIPGCYPLNNRCLTEEERKQQKLLMKRNAFNHCYSNEAKEVLTNAKIVRENGKIDCPMLLFSSNGKETSKNWVKSQQEFAAEMDAKLLCYNCGHYMHYYKSHDICKEIKEFIMRLSGNKIEA